MHIVFYALQQCLPFTVLKLTVVSFRLLQQYKVATVLTVYGIETMNLLLVGNFLKLVATVLTVYGIETLKT